MRSQKHDEAVELFTKLIDAGGEPGVTATVLTNRGVAESRRGEWRRAIADYRECFGFNPSWSPLRNNLAWLLAVCPVDELRDGHEAVELATAACNATAWCNPSCLGTLAAASAELGDFDTRRAWRSVCARRPRIPENLRRSDGGRPLAAV